MSTLQLSLRLVQVLHGPSACVADQDLLRLLGSGNIATPRDVAWAIVQEALGLSELEDPKLPNGSKSWELLHFRYSRISAWKLEGSVLE